MPKRSLLLWTLLIVVIGFILEEYHNQKHSKLASEFDRIEREIQTRENFAVWLSDSTNSLSKLLGVDIDSVKKLTTISRNINEHIYLIDSLKEVKEKLEQFSKKKDNDVHLQNDTSLNALITDINRPLGKKQILILEEQIKLNEHAILAIKLISVIYLAGVVLIFVRNKSANMA